MTFYLLYKIGCFLSVALPLKISYAVACAIADMYYRVSRKDRNAILKNLDVILGDEAADPGKAEGIAREVFRNFAKYLVDFFRFSKIDLEYIKEFVKIEGLDNIDKARSKGKGVIALSAHIGNWELGGFVLPMIGYPTSAVVLTHQNKLINDFFTRQRSLSKLKPIEIGPSLRSCYRALKSNCLLALLGDRDFSKNGMYIDFFGKKALIPKGPSVLSYRIGSAIVPCFMIREADDTFRFIFEEPIFPDPDMDEEKAVRELTRKYLSAIERCIKKYPAQWYVFREVWNNNGDKNLRSDTIV